MIVVRYFDLGDPTDKQRVAGLLFLLRAFELACLGIASRGYSRAFRWFAAAVLCVVGGAWLTTILITPLMASWVEKNMGIGVASTFDLVRPEETRGIGKLINEPGAEFVYRGTPGSIREFSVTVRNKSWGFHDRERAFENPDGCRRIVVLGDNYVQALQVPRDRAFPAVLEEMLSRDPECVEVIRLVRGGIGQVEELELLREYGPGLAPDLVILLWATNDLLDNDPELAALRTKPPGTLLFPGLLADRLVSKWLSKRVYLLLHDEQRLTPLRPDYWAHLEPTPEPARAAFVKTEALLDEILKECESTGSQLMLVIKRPNNVLR
jgi:hypothetical protein